MFFNPHVFAAAYLAVMLFMLGRLIGQRTTQPIIRGIFIVVFALACIPSLLLIAYYLHIFGEPLWYVDWRSAPYTEVLSALCAPLFGILSASELMITSGGWRKLRIFIIALGGLLVVAPFLKPILLPVSLATHWENRWQDGVCMQSGYSTCGPAALATLFTYYGCQRTEYEVARASYSSVSGTELWYMMRYARQQGFQVYCRHEADIFRVQVPAILGTRVSVYGHFIVLFAASHGRVTIGDPLTGRANLSIAEFRSRYAFSGCVLTILK